MMLTPFELFEFFEKNMFFQKFKKFKKMQKMQKNSRNPRAIFGEIFWGKFWRTRAREKCAGPRKTQKSRFCENGRFLKTQVKTVRKSPKLTKMQK